MKMKITTICLFHLPGACEGEEAMLTSSACKARDTTVQLLCLKTGDSVKNMTPQLGEVVLPTLFLPLVQENYDGAQKIVITRMHATILLQRVRQAGRSGEETDSIKQTVVVSKLRHLEVACMH